MKNHRIVLLGVLGSGKTSLYNRITNSQEETKAGGDSVTTSVFLKQSISALGFDVLDTPGFQCESNKLLHAAAVVAALAEGELSRIVIIVKFERTDLMIKNIKHAYNPCQRFREIITVIVTHWDQSENKDSDQKNILEKLSTLNISSVLFVSKQDSGSLICAQMDLILKDSNFMTVKLNDTEIYSQFDLVSLTDHTNDEIEQDQVKIIMRFRKIATQYKDYIRKFNSSSFNLVNIMHALIISIRDEAEKEVVRFTKMQGNRILQLVDRQGNNISFLYFIMLKKALFKDVEDVILQAQEKMKQNGTHCYNYIRQCPNCGLIWMKVAGCDGFTTCGNRIGQEIDQILKNGSQPGQVKVEVKDGKLIITDPEDIIFIARWFKSFFSKKPEKKQQTPQIQIQQNNLNIQGCKTKFRWKDLTPLSDNILKELISPEILEYFTNKDQILKDECIYLEQAYKELVNQAIYEQRKSIVRKQ